MKIPEQALYSRNFRSNEELSLSIRPGKTTKFLELTTNSSNTEIQRSDWCSTLPSNCSVIEKEPPLKVTFWHLETFSNINGSYAEEQIKSGSKSLINRSRTIFTNENFLCGILIGAIVAGIALGPVVVVYIQDHSEKTMTATATATATEFVYKAFWSFDNNTLELYNALDGTPSGIPSYTTSVFGYGAAINLVQSSTQYVYISSTVLPINSRSFTIEAWIYPKGLTTVEYGIFGQCQSTTLNLCLHFTIRNRTLHCGFFSNDVQGVTTVALNRWSHVACVYDYTNQIQQVWLNGVLDASHSASPYQGIFGNTTIGATFAFGNASSFNGYIDQVRFESRAKSATEILIDASLCVYYSFNSDSHTDNGPNGINGTITGNLTAVAGRLNGGIQFSSVSYISYTYPPFYFLGISNRSFSFSLWAQPSGSYNASTLIFVKTLSLSWCLGFLVMKSNGVLTAHLWNGGDVVVNGPTLPLNSWTHIGYTYSYGNGMQLYINGTLYSSSGSFVYSASGTLMYVILGSAAGQTVCYPYYGGQFIGVLDEFYLYNREITASEVYALANV